MSAEEKLLAMMNKTKKNIDELKVEQIKILKKKLIWSCVSTPIIFLIILLSKNVNTLKFGCFAAFFVIFFSEIYIYCLKKDIINGENHFV